MLSFLQFLNEAKITHLYHGTSSKHLDSIYKTGIRATPNGSHSQPENRSYVTTDLKKAHREAGEATHGGGFSQKNYKGEGGHPVVLKINRSKVGKGWKVDPNYHNKQYGIERKKKGNIKASHAFYQTKDIPAHAIEGHYDHTGEYHPRPSSFTDAHAHLSTEELHKKRNTLLAKKNVMPMNAENREKHSVISGKIGKMTQSLRSRGEKI